MKGTDMNKEKFSQEVLKELRDLFNENLWKKKQDINDESLEQFLRMLEKGQKEKSTFTKAYFKHIINFDLKDCKLVLEMLEKEGMVSKPNIFGWRKITRDFQTELCERIQSLEEMVLYANGGAGWGGDWHYDRLRYIGEQVYEIADEKRKTNDLLRNINLELKNANNERQRTNELLDKIADCLDYLSNEMRFSK